MAKRIQFRGGTTAQHNVFTGAIREITVDTDKDTLVVHDGSTVGGFPLARESVLSEHTNRIDNPHSVTKAQIGLSNVDNTADENKVVLSASKLTTARTITISGDASGSASFDGSADTTITIAVADDSHAHAFANITSKPTTLAGYGITDADTSAQVTTKINNAVAGLVASAPAALDTLNEFALALGNDANFATTTATALGNRVIKNADIVAGTGTKITYDSKGLVTGSSTPTTLAGYSISNAYTKTEVNNSLALKVDYTDIASVNLLRADKYLAAQNIANMVYTGGDLTKIQYKSATDVDYETLNYSGGNLVSINHYTIGVLSGTTTLSYSGGNLVSAIFVGV